MNIFFKLHRNDTIVYQKEKGIKIERLLSGYKNIF